MEMEHINKNTIRVLIDNDDLNARGITILDLLGDHQQIEDFFYSILREVDTDHQFQDNDAVTFQVMPTERGLELFISKNDPNDPNADNNAQIARYIKNNLARSAANQKNNTPVQPVQSQQLNAAEPHQANSWRVVVFDVFENLIDFARIAEDDDIVSDLYKYNDKYYLVLQYFQPVENKSLVEDSLALAYEYGNRTAMTPDYLSEHGKKLMTVSALHTVRHYFN
ncbi:MAG: adaptor protein MecA [Limosilactobacillus pontis]|uniref:Adapter protein MecA n=1 Tax=Limosilactobacillus pontis TaxID=35787 RepID=A0A2J6NKY5_9LACO|nr:adaptor protein MecA [Limosilactobacillus pontis]PMB81999.1 adaptor protein MecA [Limosilactobacillus pontis]